MSATVEIKKASWRNIEIKNVTLPLNRAFKQAANKKDGIGTIVVDASSISKMFPSQFRDASNIRIKVNQHHIKVTGVVDEVNNDTTVISETLVDVPLEGEFNGETEEAAIKRINERFAILDEMTAAISNNDIKAMIVAGPPGIGKSSGVETVLLRNNILQSTFCDDQNFYYEIIKGSISPVGLYTKLYEFSDKNNVLVFDDCDDVLLDPLSLSLLKAALDSSKKRILSWNKQSWIRNIDDAPPDRFEYRGGIIFITNLDFTQCRSKVLKPHLDAMLSRCHYLSLDVNTIRDKFLRIKDVTLNSDMLADYEFSSDEKNYILDYMKANMNNLRELSLRTVIKIADVIKMKGIDGNWQNIVNLTVLKRKDE